MNSCVNNTPLDLRCNNSTEDSLYGAIKEDVAQCNGTHENSEEGTNHVNVSIFRLRQQEEFIYNLHSVFILFLFS